MQIDAFANEGVIFFRRKADEDSAAGPESQDAHEATHKFRNVQGERCLKGQ